MDIHGLPRNPASLAILVFAWFFCLLAGVTFLWQAFFHKAPPAKSKLGTLLLGMLFRFRVVAGLGLLAFVVYGVVWALNNWK
jgi:hypothetical protein